jgi:hypothetical protein
MKWRFQVPSLSEDLGAISVQLMKLSTATKQENDKNNETTYAYYYSKGGLDYRDKLLALLSTMPKGSSALQAFYLVLNQFPDPYADK